MAIRRTRIDRKVNLTATGGQVVDMSAGWTITLDCLHHGRISFDFNRFRENGRDELAEHMRDAFWRLRHEVVGATLQSMDYSLRQFWRFLDDLDAFGISITHLSQIDRKLLDRYLGWLELRVASKGKNIGQGLSIKAKKRSFDNLKSILLNCQKHSSSSVSQALSFPRNPFPNSNLRTPVRESYSESEQRSILNALNQDLRSIHEGEEALKDLQILLVHVLLLALATGCNLQSLLDLRRDSIREHPLPDRDLLVTTKRRGWTTHAMSFRKTDDRPEDAKSMQAIPASIGEHIHFVMNFTTPLAEKAAEADRQFVFLWQATQGPRKGLVARMNRFDTLNAIKEFVQRHKLTDDRGCSLALNVARLRPTFATELYRRTRDIRRVQQSLGHAKVETTVRYYTEKPLEAERDHAIVLDEFTGRFMRMKIDGKVLIAADGQVPQQGMNNLLSGGYNTGFARCSNPFRKNDDVCKKFLTCFRCPSMCVFEDDLWRLFSFYYRLLAERSKINPAHWMKTYAPIIRRIDSDIAPQFPMKRVEAARLKAQIDPHPTWKLYLAL